MVDVMSLYVWLYPNNKNKNPNNFASVDVRARSALRLLVIIYSKQHFGAGGQVLVLFLPARPALVHCEVFAVTKKHISVKICTTYIFLQLSNGGVAGYLAARAAEAHCPTAVHREKWWQHWMPPPLYVCCCPILLALYNQSTTYTLDCLGGLFKKV